MRTKRCMLIHCFHMSKANASYFDVDDTEVVLIRCGIRSGVIRCDPRTESTVSSCEAFDLLTTPESASSACCLK